VNSDVPRAPEEGPILARLSQIGYDAPSLALLRDSGVRYRTAIPVLIAALHQTSDHKTLVEVVRALTVPWARPAATLPLIELFRNVKGPMEDSLRWVIGNALDVTWHDDYFDELEKIARDTTYGRSREMVVLGFARSKNPHAGQVLIDLIDDPSVNGHAVMALRKLKVPTAGPFLKRMVDDDRAWVRKEAKRALAALE
jgi:hypothetical protein